MTLLYGTVYIPLLGLLLGPFLKGTLDKIVLGFLVVCVSVFLGTKTMGADYQSYVQLFSEIQRAGTVEELLDVVQDPLLWFIVKFLHVFSDSGNLIFFTIATFSLVAVAFALPQNLKHKSLAFSAYILVFGGGLYYEAIRAGLGVALYYLFVRLIDRKWSIVFSLLAVSSHISLAVPVSVSFNPIRTIIARHYVISGLLFLGLSNVIPILLLVSERSLFYTNVEGNASRIAVVLSALLLAYLWLTRRSYVESSARFALTSSALVTLALSAILSFYAEIASSRLYELGGALFLLLMIGDFARGAMRKLPTMLNVARWAIVGAFALLHAYVWYMRFIVNYQP
jgi:EpsG family